MFLLSLVEYKTRLKSFWRNKSKISMHLNENIIAIIEILVNMDVDNKINIEKPFSYRPYVNLNPNAEILNGKRVFPIGDSLYCGHPKIGNGLGYHMRFINEIVKSMIKN